MIIQKISLTNFGIFGGTREFDLTPASTDQFARPIVLFRGKNGVGKTTLVEAMRLCLHGSLVLGNRVGQQEFEEYIARRIHRGLNGTGPANEIGVEMAFDYVEHGRQSNYQVKRSWKLHGDKPKINEFSIKKDDEWLKKYSDDQKDQLLREMIPPGVLDVFFFDGERVQTLAEETGGERMLLTDTVNSMLGLDIVEQLYKDIDVFIARLESGNGVTPLQAELDALLNTEESLDQECRSVQERWHEVTSQSLALVASIAAQEQRISSQGGDFANRYDELLNTKQNLEAEVEHARRAVQELCSGLMPFAVAPSLLKAVSSRLELERNSEQNRAAQLVIANKLASLRKRMRSDEYWYDAGIPVDGDLRETIFDRIQQELVSETAADAVSADETILQVTDRERTVLQEWIGRALDEIPRQFSEAIRSLAYYEWEMGQVKDQLSRVPPKDSIAPLLEELGELHKRRALLESELASLTEQESSLRYQMEQLAFRKRRIHEEFREQQSNTSRVHQALKTQAMLEAYKDRVTQARIVQLEEILLKRFNLLCRKTMLLDDLKINPDNFQVTLIHQGKTFSRKQLSAGENQLFAIATLWALREISGRPMPVVVDTPLSRLDTTHRATMIQEFFPRTSHQVIVLATDSEIDDAMIDRLRPAISHIYDMRFNPHTGSMEYETRGSEVMEESPTVATR